jgi:hypothetical protein
MWVVLYVPNQKCYTVGFFNPEGGWHAHRDFTDKEDAARYIHWLYGGDPEQKFHERIQKK